MRLKKITLVYIILGIVYAIVPAIVFGLVNGRTIPSVTVNNMDVLIAFSFSFVPFVVGFLGGEMYANDMADSDPLEGYPKNIKHWKP